MDAHEDEGDIKLQKESAELITEFGRALPNFLRKSDGHGGSRLRTRVRVWERHRLDATILAPFQELPQLLDPHLSKFIPVLSDAYRESLTARGRQGTSSKSKLLEPLPRAVARLLYTFCKIRGEKVVVRFLGAETKYLEPLLTAIEDAEKVPEAAPDGPLPSGWTWEERYVTLLWLSHLLFVPFDLASISSIDLSEISAPVIAGLIWPQNLPGITLRLVPLAIKYLASPGKERDAAKALLVRISMRKDMQELGMLDALIGWSLRALRPTSEPPTESPYYFIGILSYLAGILRSSMDTSDADQYLVPIYNATNSITAGGNPTYAAINGSALARKMMIKVMRSAAVLVLRQQPPTPEGTELVEMCIGTLLEKVSDNDTPVRLAASKALSVITLRLDPDMASQVVEVVLDSLNQRVVWHKDSANPDGKMIRDLSSVNPLEWHGLVLTLSHLLYRRSPPPDQLSDIVHALLLGLSFEQRTTSGGSLGSNVRDAACFGIWGLSRRYTTKELLEIPTESVFAAKSHPPGSSILQVLATELIVTASRDPAGNIRRGSSAALQELVGRHPETVENGIFLVQTVDYHAVALRSRAINEVALNATNLSSRYGEALLDSLLGWRGVGDADAGARRATGESFGAITLRLASLAPGSALSRFEGSVNIILGQLRKLQTRQTEERHGLLLSLSHVFDILPNILALAAEGAGVTSDQLQGLMGGMVGHVVGILQGLKSANNRRQELIAEGASRLVVSSIPIFHAITLAKGGWTADSVSALRKGQSVTARENADEFLRLVAAFDSAHLAENESEELVAALRELLPTWLEFNEEEVVDAVSEAASVKLMLSTPADRARSIRQWADAVRVRSPRVRNPSGHFHALAMAYPLSLVAEPEEDDDANVVCRALLERWSSERDIETKSFLLRSLAQSDVLYRQPGLFLHLLWEALNDYTTTSRGDVGAYLRGGALKATRRLWETARSAASADLAWLRRSVSRLFLSVLRLSAEKLDRIRNEAHKTLALLLNSSHAKTFDALSTSSPKYLDTLLNMVDQDALVPAISDTAKADKPAWMAELLAGLVTSADTGNEKLVIASRASLASFCERSQSHLDLVCSSLVRNLRERQGQGQDRVLVPTLEIVSYLLNVGLFQMAGGVDARAVCLLVQKSCYKSSNVRKIETCIKVYGGIARLGESGEGQVRLTRVEEGVREARKRLGALMFHPWPKVRGWVVDELWSVVEREEEAGGDGGGDGVGARLKGVDWGVADKAAVREAVKALGIEVG